MVSHSYGPTPRRATEGRSTLSGWRSEEGIPRADRDRGRGRIAELPFSGGGATLQARRRGDCPRVAATGGAAGSEQSGTQGQAGAPRRPDALQPPARQPAPPQAAPPQPAPPQPAKRPDAPQLPARRPYALRPAPPKPARPQSALRRLAPPRSAPPKPAGPQPDARHAVRQPAPRQPYAPRLGPRSLAARRPDARPAPQ